MPLPGILANPLFQAAALQIVGGLTGSALAGKEPEVPDLSGRRVASYQNEAEALDDALGRQLGRETANQAAQGVSGSGGVARLEAMTRASNDAIRSQNAAAADSIAEAEEQEDIMRFRQQSGKRQNRVQAISDISGVGGQMLALRYLEGKYGLADRSLDTMILKRGLDQFAPDVTGHRVSPGAAPQGYNYSFSPSTLAELQRLTDPNSANPIASR